MDKLIGEFLIETTEVLNQLDKKILDLKKNHNDLDTLNSMFCSIHSIKGVCGFLNLPKLEFITHACENLMDRIRSGDLKIDNKVISSLSLSINSIKEIILYLSENDGVEPAEISNISSVEFDFSQRLNFIKNKFEYGEEKICFERIGQIWKKFPLMVDYLAKKLNKKIRLKIYGENIEIDKNIVGYINDSITHMIRNAADHGLEIPELRVRNNKSEIGTIILNAYYKDNFIVIELSDDGQGINEHKIREKIIEKKLASRAEVMGLSITDLAKYLFLPGFSTAEKITLVSGRGVGLEIVSSNIEKIHGTIELDSIVGKGTKFTIKIPR